MAEAQAHPAYPWDEYKEFIRHRRIAGMFTSLTFFIFVIGAIISPIALIPFIWGVWGFWRFNDAWQKRGIYSILIGAIIQLINPVSFGEIWDAFSQLMSSFGQAKEISPLDAALHYLVVGAPIGFITAGLYLIARSYDIEVSTNYYLKTPIGRPIGQRLRLAVTKYLIRHDKDLPWRRRSDYIRFGAEVGSRFKWRNSRYGMMVEKPLDEVGHGFIAGGSGVGKTSFTASLIKQLLEFGSGIISIDLKASRGTTNAYRSAAKSAGAKFTLLDLSYGSTDTSWIDLFDWRGSAGDKASVLIENMQFDDAGGAGFYKNVAKSWAPLQLEIKDLVGMRPGEGVFDFLLATATPDGFMERLEPLQDRDHGLYKHYKKSIFGTKADDLKSYRAELEKIITSAGPRLRPNPQNPTPISIREVFEEGGMLHIALSSAVNDVTLKVIGSLLIKMMEIIVEERNSNIAYRDRSVRTYMIFDEASQLGERTERFKALYDKSREANSFLIVIFQSLGAWDLTTISALKSNSYWFAALLVNDIDTGEIISSMVPVVHSYTAGVNADSSRGGLFGGRREMEETSEARLQVKQSPHLGASSELMSIDRYHAWIWFKNRSVSMSRDKWLGQRRVRRDMNKDHVPMTMLVPYDETIVVSTLATEDSSGGFVQPNVLQGQPQSVVLGGGQDGAYSGGQHGSYPVGYQQSVEQPSDDSAVREDEYADALDDSVPEPVQVPPSPSERPVPVSPVQKIDYDAVAQAEGFVPVPRRSESAAQEEVSGRSLGRKHAEIVGSSQHSVQGSSASEVVDVVPVIEEETVEVLDDAAPVLEEHPVVSDAVEDDASATDPLDIPVATFFNPRRPRKPEGE